MVGQYSESSVEEPLTGGSLQVDKVGGAVADSCLI